MPRSPSGDLAPPPGVGADRDRHRHVRRLDVHARRSGDVHAERRGPHRVRQHDRRPTPWSVVRWGDEYIGEVPAGPEARTSATSRSPRRAAHPRRVPPRVRRDDHRPDARVGIGLTRSPRRRTSIGAVPVSRSPRRRATPTSSGTAGPRRRRPSTRTIRTTPSRSRDAGRGCPAMSRMVRNADRSGQASTQNSSPSTVKVTFRAVGSSSMGHRGTVRMVACRRPCSRCPMSNDPRRGGAQCGTPTLVSRRRWSMMR